MIVRHSSTPNPSISYYSNRFRHLRVYFMAGASNYTLGGQRDFQTLLSVRKFSSNSPCSSSSMDVKFISNSFRSKGFCSENYRIRNDSSNNEIQKFRAYAPACIPRLLRVHEEVENQPSIVGFSEDNGDCGMANRGNFHGVVNQSLNEKIMVAVDVDEVLGNFVSALNQFIADRYSLNCSVSEYHVYEFFKIWNCSRSEADIRVHEFFKTQYFKKGIYPIPGARKALEKLSEIYNLCIVTSRQNAIKDHTIEWIHKHYPGLFDEIHFGNHFAMDGQQSRPKSEICKCLGAKVLIDDNPRYAMECAQVGIKVLLFDYQNSYPWCKTMDNSNHPLVTKVHNWEEVEHHLASLVSS